MSRPNSVMSRMRHSTRSSSQSSWTERRTSLPPIRKGSLPDRLQLGDGRSAERVPCSLRPLSDPAIAFYHEGHRGVLVNDIFHGKHVQDSQETVAMAGPSTIFLQWPGYGNPEIRDIGRVTVYLRTIQDLAVEVCNALRFFYMRAAKITPSESVSWALFSKINLKDIVLVSISFDAGVWIPEFYVLRK